MARHAPTQNLTSTAADLLIINRVVVIYRIVSIVFRVDDEGQGWANELTGLSVLWVIDPRQAEEAQNRSDVYVDR